MATDYSQFLDALSSALDTRDLALLGKDGSLPAITLGTLPVAIGKGVAGGVAGLNGAGKPVDTAGNPAAVIGTTAGTAADAAAVTAAIAASANTRLSTAGGTVTGPLTVQTPTAAGHAATKAYVDSIGTTIDAVPNSAKGAASGVASLDSAARIFLAQVPAGYRHTVIWQNGPNAWPATRPSTRTDIYMYCVAPAGTADPTWLGSYPFDEVWTY